VPTNEFAATVEAVTLDTVTAGHVKLEGTTRPPPVPEIVLHPNWFVVEFQVTAFDPPEQLVSPAPVTLPALML
jgi:hypothetical protein